jgi:hypothetical protein
VTQYDLFLYALATVFWKMHFDKMFWKTHFAKMFLKCPLLKYFGNCIEVLKQRAMPF